VLLVLLAVIFRISVFDPKPTADQAADPIPNVSQFPRRSDAVAVPQPNDEDNHRDCRVARLSPCPTASSSNGMGVQARRGCR
jgi:hypothetical protein